VTLVYCGQMVGWIKMPLGMEVGIGPGDVVLDGDSASSNGNGQRNPSHPHFSAHCSGTVAHLSDCWAHFTSHILFMSSIQQF